MAGVLLGFFLGQNVDPIERLKIVKETTIDTVFQPEIVEVKIEKEIKSIDTVFIMADNVNPTVKDTLIDSSATLLKDTSTEDELKIKQDLKIKSDTIELIIIKSEIVDSLQSKLLGVKSVKQERILLEYWESPLSYQGYKLSKTKLIVYGVLPIKKSKIYKYERDYYLNVDDLFYKLNETQEFVNIVNTSKPSFIND